ncbi:acetyltransferase [Oxynema sp. CENA135]|uniref:GNAT family N-acetyltransferase n=1 Tax=Oxynema sp. CENA135 TaxID=984206 RepID=UPI00190AE9A7|nr:GNAT family N-acetyltransferase [Oxynema sp. CENA135]MBK4729007.1 acetyltransferase [Oxynema sp. CENA135]
MKFSQTEAKPQFTYEKFDRSLEKTIAFRPVELEKDLDRIHRWMNEPHVIPFWQLNFDRDRMRSHLEKALSDRHQTLYIGYLDGVPMSYWEAYWAQDDVIAQCYEPDAGDRGIHLLIGEPKFLGKGYALPLLRAMTDLQFEFSATPKLQTQKVVTEPDIRNDKMIHIFKRCGFVFQREIELPDKRAALMFCDRQSFREKWER